MTLAGSRCQLFEPQFRIENISNDTCLSENPSIACSPSGTVTLAWQDCKAGPSDIWLIEKPMGGQWGAAQNLTQNTDIYNASRWPSVCYDSAGNLHAVWQQGTDQGWAIFYRKRDAAHAWSLPETIRIGLPTDPQLGVDFAGNVHVLIKNIAGSGFDICHTMRTIAGAWLPVHHLGDPSQTQWFGAALAVMADGTCCVAWAENAFAPQPRHVYCSIRSADGVWLAPVPDSALSELSYLPEYPALASSAQTFYLAYARHHDIFFRTYSATSGWEDMSRISNAGRPEMLSLAVDGQKRLHVLWTESSSGRLLLARHDQHWNQFVVSETLGDDENRTGVVVDPGGRVHLTWDRGRISPGEVFYATGLAD